MQVVEAVGRDRITLHYSDMLPVDKRLRPVA